MKNGLCKYLVMAATALIISSCDSDEPLVEPVQKVPLKFEVGAYPSYDASRSIGTPDAGKADWADDDIILVKVTDGGVSKTLTLTYGNGVWTPSEEVVTEGTPTVEVLYAPGCEWGNGDEVELKSADAPYGTFEYVEGDSDLSGGAVLVNFAGRRTYSRLRMVPGFNNADINVVTTGFSPAGPSSAKAPIEGYSLTTDAKGNAYLYGSFTSNATVQVMKDDVVVKEYTFTAATSGNMSYAMDAIPYVTFSADAAQTLTMSKAVATLEYSVGGGEWAELGTTTVAFGGDKGDLRLRGKSSIGTGSADGSWLESSIVSFGDEEVKVACTGDIRTLVDYENYATTSTANARFTRLFMGCSNLISAPDLPATELADGCYWNMFDDCASLKEAPALPATVMKKTCYGAMFADCISLTTPPDLPATVLAEDCYYAMFGGCKNLITAPELPAESLADNCYNRMFAYTNITIAPELPATTVADSCYAYMFGGCGSLISTFDLPATKLAEGCYSNMFNGCPNLAEAPALPATELAIGCYESMFRGCASLTEAPELPATELAHSCYHSMFYGCQNLSVAPELPVTELATDCYRQMFVDCTSLTEAPELPATVLPAGCYAFMFSGCTSLDEAPELPATTLDYLCYYNMFSRCTSLIVAPALPVMTLANDCYSSMFEGCTGLLTAPVLPATTLANGCYSSMFRGCTSLTESPLLSAQTLKERCYTLMFDGCTNLNKVTMLATDISATDCLTDWLSNVASTGTFIKAKEMTTLPTGASGIPEGWTVRDNGSYMGGWTDEIELN